MRQKRDLEENVWTGWQRRLIQASPCSSCVGGDTFFQRGAFYAAAPWRGVQATSFMFRARLLGGGDASIQRGGF
jgi:hypothetical protein